MNINREKESSVKKTGYKNFSLIAMSVMVSIPTIALSASPTPSKEVTKASTGLYFDLGVQADVAYSSTKYVETTYNRTNSPNIDLEQLLDSKPIKGEHGPNFSPTVFAGIRYYYTKRAFIGFHVGDTLTHRKLFRFSYFDGETASNEHDIKIKLQSHNMLYGKLFFGYFITPWTNFNISALSVYDHYRLTYQVNSSDSVVTYHKKPGGSGYGVGLGIERYLSDHIIVSLNYTFIQHNSINKKLHSTRFSDTAGTFDDNYMSHLLFNPQENIISLGFTVEI